MDIDRIAGRRPTRPLTWAVVALAALIVSAPARAFDTSQLGQGGSLLLGDIMPLIEQSPALKREVADEAGKIGKKPEEILCGGMRFSGRWVELGGARVSPYICGFGDKRFLEIRATVRLTSAAGKDFEKVTPAALKNASEVRETKPTWKWLTEDPRSKDR